MTQLIEKAPELIRNGEEKEQGLYWQARHLCLWPSLQYEQAALWLAFNPINSTCLQPSSKPISLDFPTLEKQMWTICRLCALQYVSLWEQSRPGLHRPVCNTLLCTGRAQVLGAGLWASPEAFLLSCVDSPKSYQDDV